MNRVSLAGALLVAAALSCTSCKFVSYKGGDFCSGGTLVASDSLVTRSMEVGDFKSLKVEVPCDVKFSTGPKSVSVHAAGNLVDALAFEVDSTGCLGISTPGYSQIRNAKTVVFTISAPTLEGLTINGASDVELDGSLVADSFIIDISGAGDVEADSIKAANVSVNVRGAGDIEIGDLDCDALSVSVSGAGDCTFAGRADSADIDVRGAGDVDISELNVKDLTKSVKGAGTVRTK